MPQYSNIMTRACICLALYKLLPQTCQGNRNWASQIEISTLGLDIDNCWSPYNKLSFRAELENSFLLVLGGERKSTILNIPLLSALSILLASITAFFTFYINSVPNIVLFEGSHACSIFEACNGLQVEPSMQQSPAQFFQVVWIKSLYPADTRSELQQLVSHPTQSIVWFCIIVKSDLTKPVS